MSRMYERTKGSDGTREFRPIGWHCVNNLFTVPSVMIIIQFTPTVIDIMFTFDQSKRLEGLSVSATTAQIVRCL